MGERTACGSGKRRWGGCAGDGENERGGGESAEPKPCWDSARQRAQHNLRTGSRPIGAVRGSRHLTAQPGFTAALHSMVGSQALSCCCAGPQPVPAHIAAPATPSSAWVAGRLSCRKSGTSLADRQTAPHCPRQLSSLDALCLAARPRLLSRPSQLEREHGAAGGRLAGKDVLLQGGLADGARLDEAPEVARLDLRGAGWMAPCDCERFCCSAGSMHAASNLRHHIHMLTHHSPAR